MSYNLRVVVSETDKRKAMIIAEELGWQFTDGELRATTTGAHEADTLMKSCLFALRMSGVQILSERTQVA